ncbi:allose kinase [Canicola haemoglobinophilus]|uniref:D-allose kinase n=1 Tax=Canicola haemoglobinophilus TaxID=733 RepID=A0A1V4B393_9PAST|nr:allose kinase [Canicola haemoglobinophilus]OOS01810.1 allose kinase [Canicola haemoglobinophilus]STO60706.1 D-allose kinase [Canicola haemoglobinophilus]
MADIFVGIDMGATHIRICLLDQKSQVILTDRQKTKDVLGENLLNGLTDFCQKYINEHNVKSIVIGLPAAISADRKNVLSVPNLNMEPQNFSDLVPYLSKKFNCEVYLERDVNLQMIYDVNFYKLQNKIALGVYLGTGLGFSIWLNGRLFLGTNGVAGELGHIPYGDKNLLCSCGNQACLETLCSGRALKHWYEEQQFEFAIEEIFTHQCNHPFIKDYLTNLAKAISTVVNLFDPHGLILGGGVMDMPDFPLESLKRLLANHIRKPLPYRNLTIFKAEPSLFNGAIGAALYASQHIGES